MIGKCRDQTNNTIRDFGGDSDEIRVSEWRQITKAIHTARELIEDSRISHPVQNPWVYAKVYGLACAQDTAVLAEHTLRGFDGFLFIQHMDNNAVTN